MSDAIPEDRTTALNARELHGPPADIDLLARMRRADETALAALYDRYAGLVITVALRVVGDREVAEEILQDTFLRCWNGVETYQPARGHVAGWLMGIARNRAIDVLRSRQHRARQRERTALPDADDPHQPGNPDESEAVVLRHTVTSALATLPLNQRQVIELAYYGGLSQTEIAQRLGEPLGTVKSRTRTAMDRLRVLLGPQLRSMHAPEPDDRRMTDNSARDRGM
jgi:RNA polymerase sigma-70 factor (ECF subfamily)